MNVVGHPVSLIKWLNMRALRTVVKEQAPSSKLWKGLYRDMLNEYLHHRC